MDHPPGRDVYVAGAFRGRGNEAAVADASPGRRAVAAVAAGDRPSMKGRYARTRTDGQGRARRCGRDGGARPPGKKRPRSGARSGHERFSRGCRPNAIDHSLCAEVRERPDHYPAPVLPAASSVRFVLAAPGVLHALAAPALLRPGAPVDHHQMAFLRPALLHVAQRLLHPALDRAGEALPGRIPQHLALDHEPLPESRRLARLARPPHQQVRPAAPETVLPFDAAAPVHHPMQVRLQGELRRRLGILGEAPEPVPGVLPEERAERRQQLRQVQPPIVVHVPSRVHVQAALRDVAQLARHHLRVDRVRDARRLAAVDEAEVAEVFEVPNLAPRLTAAQDGLDDPPHPLLLQLVRELVEVRAPREDQLLARRVDVVLLDGARAVPSRLVVEAGPGEERIHQPELAPGLRPHRVQRRPREALPRLLRVLGHQGVRLRFREVAQAKGLRRHVERAPPGDDLAGARPDAVVADVPHPAQHHALRETLGALLVAGPELAQHQQQGVPHQ